MHWTEVWNGSGAKARLARASLTPLSWLYAAGWEAYLSVYKLGLKKQKEPHKPIVCVGNLLAGGSGKSPVTLFLASLMRELGHEVVVGCSGYGSPRSESASVAPPGQLDAREWGDEPSMMRWLSPDLKLIVGRDRVEAARLCHEHAPQAVLLMDDGFQHLPLRKHLTILLDPPSNNHRCLPSGPYREPWRHRARADLVLPNGFRVCTKLNDLVGLDGKALSITPGSEVNVLCAIGNPNRFIADLQQLELKIVETVVRPDHDPLEMGNLFASLKPNVPIIVTAKDWVKLKRRSDLGTKNILIARQEAHIEPLTEFKSWLALKLDELSIKPSAR